MLLRLALQGDLTYAGVLELAGSAVGDDAAGYRSEFLDLVKKCSRWAVECSAESRHQTMGISRGAAPSADRRRDPSEEEHSTATQKSTLTAPLDLFRPVELRCKTWATDHQAIHRRPFPWPAAIRRSRRCAKPFVSLPTTFP